MQNLKVPVAALPKVGPKYAEILSKLKIETVEDLLYYFPYRYENYSNVKAIKDLQPEETVTIEATILRIDNIFTRNSKKITKATAQDETGQLEIVWFNQHYIKNTIIEGIPYYFSGRVNSFNNKLSLVAPQFEQVRKENINTARLVPVYSETYGVSSKWLRTRIDFILKTLLAVDPIAETLPTEIIQNEKLLELNQALKNIHFPENDELHLLAKERLAFEELFKELIKIEKRKHFWRNENKGAKITFKRFEKKIEQFIETLPFTLTNSQVQVLQDIKQDLDKSFPMNRLVEGDVGSGKTIVAVVAAYLTHLNGFKTVYMAPTELLATQHYETFKKYLDDFGVNVQLYTGSSKPEKLEEADIIIGTHALLYMQDKLPNIGLVVIDEQHRFGVEQRATLTRLGSDEAKPNVLTMTATPIPRTLALTLYGDLDLSVLSEVPNKNKNIKTKVLEDKYRQKTYEWIKDQNKKAFIVCPLIEESDSETMENVKAVQVEYESLKNGVFKDIEVGLLHGRMSAKEKNEVMLRFRNDEIRVLVSTPVIEVGVDIPDAEVIVIESAERYGLASLHQLRGRVGRGISEAHCILFMSNFSKRGFTRLKNLEAFDSGLKLAEIDMEFRGEGDTFGVMQHGFRQFKIADITDIEFLSRVKKCAEETYKNVTNYPKLQAELEHVTQQAVKN